MSEHGVCEVCGRPKGWIDRRDTCPVWLASFDRWVTRWENLAVHYRLGYERLLLGRPTPTRETPTPESK